MINDTDDQPDRETYVRPGKVLGWGTPVPLELGCTNPQHMGVFTHPGTNITLLSFYGGFIMKAWSINSFFQPFFPLWRMRVSLSSNWPRTQEPAKSHLLRTKDIPDTQETMI